MRAYLHERAVMVGMMVAGAGTLERALRGVVSLPRRCGQHSAEDGGGHLLETPCCGGRAPTATCTAISDIDYDDDDACDVTVHARTHIRTQAQALCSCEHI